MTHEDQTIVFLVHPIHLPDLEQIAKEKLRRTVQNETGKELGRELEDASAIIIDADVNI